MGRPIKDKFFGNLQPSSTNGFGVAGVAVKNGGTAFSGSATATFSAPQLAGGTVASASLTVDGGVITAVTVTSAGSGYTKPPTLTVSPATTGTNASFVVSLTANSPDIAVQAWVDGGTSAKPADIIKQVNKNRYRVSNTDGEGLCSLVGGAPTAPGQMNIMATDSAGGTYFVVKLTSRKAVLIRGTGTQFPSGAAVGWNLVAAVVGKSVKIGSV